jgi:hypothetical protein
MAMLPDPQKGSRRANFLFQPEKKRSEAAIVSLRGA